MTFLDKTFCASPECDGSCGRKITKDEEQKFLRLNAQDEWNGMLGICYAYFNHESKSKNTGNFINTQ